MFCCCPCGQRHDDDPENEDADQEARKPLLYDVGPTDGGRNYQTDQDTPVVPSIGLTPLSMDPVKVTSVDKRLQDHAQLYNDHLERRKGLLDSMNSLQEMFPEENTEQTIDGCFKAIRSQAAELVPQNITIKRKFEYSMEIEFDAKDFEPALIGAFREFNAANRSVKEIMDKAPSLVSSVQLVTNAEKDLKRDVLVASLGNEGPDCMQNCLRNLATLKLVPAKVDDIREETLGCFQELMAAARVLLMPSDEADIDEVDFPFEHWSQ